MINKMLSFGLLVVAFSAAFSLASPAVVSANDGCSTSFFGIPAWYRNLTTSDCEIRSISESGEAGSVSISTFIWTIVLNLADGLFRIAGVVATGFIVFAGLKYMVSQGNASAIAGAKTTLLNAIIGLIIAVLAISITNFSLGLIN